MFHSKIVVVMEALDSVVSKAFVEFIQAITLPEEIGHYIRLVNKERAFPINRTQMLSLLKIN